MTDETPETETRNRTFTWQDPQEVAAPIGRISGAEYMKEAVSGRLRAPIASALDFRITEAADGLCRVTMTPQEFHLNPGATVHGGVYATILDSAMFIALWSTLPAGKALTTLEMKLNMVRAITLRTGEITAEGRVIQAGRTIGLAEGRITDADGKLYAHATTTCLFVDLPPADGGKAGQ